MCSIDSDSIKLAEMDVSDFGALYSSFKFTENHHIDEAPSVFRAFGALCVPCV